MPALAEFQSQLATELLHPGETSSRYASRSEVALSVYRNTVIKGWVDALAATFPTVQRLVGEAWFTAAAAEFAREHPPRDPVLAHYGNEFPAFLESFPPANELPYLCEVARLDGLWIEAYFAADATPLSARELQTLGQQALFNSRVIFHPATRIAQLKHSAVTIWFANHPFNATEPAAAELEVDSAAESVLLTRPQLEVQAQHLSSSEYLFLRQLQTQSSLGVSAATVLDHDPQFPLASALARFINAGAFALIQTN